MAESMNRQLQSNNKEIVDTESNKRFEINRIISFYFITSLLSLIKSTKLYYKNVRKCAKKYLYFDKNSQKITCSVCHTAKHFKIKDLQRKSLDLSSDNCCQGQGHDNVPISDENDYYYAESRLLTLLQFGWPLKETDNFKVGALELARSGFICFAEKVAVQCFFCHLYIRGWEDGDTVDSEHKKWNSCCPFLKGNILIDNVPLYGTRFSENEINATSINTAKYNSFMMYLKRLNSFCTALTQSEKIKLAEAGFYFHGATSKVICAFCYAELFDWSNESATWAEHIHYSHCSCINSRKPHDNELQAGSIPMYKHGEDIQKLNSCRCLKHELSKHSIYAYLWNRYVSFKSYQLDATKSELIKKFVRNGFFFAKEKSVICYHCDFTILDWLHSDVQDLIKKHSESDCIYSKQRLAPPVECSEGKKLCKVCLQYEISCALLPCADMSCCITCAMLTENCYYCNHKVEHILPISLPKSSP